MGLAFIHFASYVLPLDRFHGVLAPNAMPDCARLLKRVFDIDIAHCACGGKLKIIAVIEEPDVIEKILKHIGLDPQPPPITPARRRAQLFEWA